MKEQAAIRPANAILVLGMHHGGTSALAGLLHLLGFEFGPSLMPAAEGVNNKGFWEHIEAFKIHERLLAALGRSRFDPREMPIGWLEHPAFRVAVDEVRALVDRDFREALYWAVKDPRMCRLAPVWLEALGALNIRTHVILIVRHPAEVARSMQAQGWIASVARSHLCWLQHMLEAEQATRGVPRALITYDALLADWRSETARIGRELALEWPDVPAGRAAEIDTFVDANERRHVESPDALPDRAAQLPPLVADLFELCRRDTADATKTWERIAVLGDTFQRGAASFGPCLDEAIVEASLAHLEIGQGRIVEQEPAARETAAVLMSAVSEAMDARLLPLREGIAGLSERLDSADATLHGLSSRLAVCADDVAGLAARQPMLDAAVVRTADLPDRTQALADAQTAVRADLSALGQRCEDSARRHAEDLQSLHETMTAAHEKLERLLAPQDARFSVRRLLGRKKKAP